MEVKQDRLHPANRNKDPEPSPKNPGVQKKPGTILIYQKERGKKQKNPRQEGTKRQFLNQIL